MPVEAWLTSPDGTEHALTATITIGRESDHDLTFHSRSVSRDHAAVCLEDGRWYVEDRGSFNGTYLNGSRLQAGARLPLRHADRIGIGKESVLFSCPAQLRDPETTEPLEEVPSAGSPQLSTFQRQVVAALCAPWLAGGSLELLPSNEEIAVALGTPGATGAVKAALRRIYAKAGLADQPPNAKRRALCRVARQRGWV